MLQFSGRVLLLPLSPSHSVELPFMPGFMDLHLHGYVHAYVNTYRQLIGVRGHKDTLNPNSDGPDPA